MSNFDELREIRAAADGNRLAQSALVTRHMPAIYRLAFRNLGDRQLAEDITQEAFLRLWKVLPGWEPRAKLSTWLYRVALNLCRDHQRKKRERLMDTLPEQTDPGLQPEAQLDQAQRHAAVHAAIAALPERQRAAVTLCNLEGLSNIAAAEVLEISVEALESLLSRGRRKLKSLLLAPAEEM